MEKLIIRGGTSLHGKIKISGAKNAVLPILAACLLNDGVTTVTNVPYLDDTKFMIQLLISLGASVKLKVSEDNTLLVRDLEIDCSKINNLIAPYEIVGKFRASTLVLGPLLARFGKVQVAMPGGCTIGERPINIHLEGLTAMGAKITEEGEFISATAEDGLKGVSFKLKFPSVGATENLLIAACLATGTTVLSNVAIEPEIENLIELLHKYDINVTLNKLNKTITILGIKDVCRNNVLQKIMPDRIEAGSYAIAVAATSGKALLVGASTKLLEGIIPTLEKYGVKLTDENDGVLVDRSGAANEKITVETNPHPNFPTDLQAQLVCLACVTNSVSYITENIWEKRLMHLQYLQKMGAKIQQNGNTIEVYGSSEPYLIAQEVSATDLRASFCLIIAGLVASGTTTIHGMHFLDRGYENVEMKLSKCGAKIHRVSE